MNLDKLKKQVPDIHERVWELAKTGLSVIQIARTLNVSEGSLRSFIKTDAALFALTTQNGKAMQRTSAKKRHASE